jgi:predicted metal-dependent peptidase
MSALNKAVKAAARALGWVEPFFGIPLAQAQFREDPEGRHTETACVTADGIVYFYSPWVSKLTKGQLQGLLAHEIMHVLMLHYYRRGDRDPRVWNIACDMTINHPLRRAGLELPEGGVFPPPAWEGWHAEKIYEELMKDPPKGGGEGSAPGQGCGVRPPELGKSPDDDSEDDDPVGTSLADAENQRKWRQAAAEARESARNQGDGRGSILAEALAVPEPRVRWTSILRRGIATARAIHGRDSTTWRKRGRRSQSIGPQFRGWQTTSASCAVVIDTSGSMSDEDLAQCVAETVAISRSAGVAVYLVTHDAAVQWQGWLSRNARPDKIQRTLVGRGGTCAHGAYKAVEQASRRFDVFVHLTDGYLSWPSWPANVRKPIVALTGHHTEKESVPAGALAIEVE